MENAIQLALGSPKILLPVSSEGPLTLTSGFSDVPSLLNGPRPTHRDFFRGSETARLAQGRGASRMTMFLRPPHLGGLRISLTISRGVLHVAFQVENPAAKGLILSQLSSLKKALENLGMEVGELGVDVDLPFSGEKRGGGEATRPALSPALSTSADAESDPAAIRSMHPQLIDVMA